LVFSEKPSASGQFPGGVTIGRNYDTLVRLQEENEPDPVVLPAYGTVELPQWGLRITCTPAEHLICDDHTFTVKTDDVIQVRSRRAGDTMRLSGGTKSLKKLFVDRKIPASQRQNIPVLADGQGVLGVFGIGVNLDRTASALPAVTVLMEKI
jgi:tRNA(Ile)-lysidine synthase